MINGDPNQAPFFPENVQHTGIRGSAAHEFPFIPEQQQAGTTDQLSGTQQQQQQQQGGIANRFPGRAGPALADRLQVLESEAESLRKQLTQLRAAMVIQAEAAATGAVADLGGEAPYEGEQPLPHSFTELAIELQALTAGCHSACGLQELAGLNKYAEGEVRAVQAAAGAASDSDYFSAVEQAVGAYGTAAAQALKLRDATAPAAAGAASLADDVEEHHHRTTAVRDALYSSLQAALQQRCSEAGWPPPITTQDEAAAGAAGGTAAMADTTSARCLFENAAPALLLALRQLLAAMFALQRADDPAGFAEAEGGGEGPPLWAVAELAAPLTDRLRRHFGGQGMPTDQVDRPEWLFTTAARLAADVSPSLAPLQPAISAVQLQHSYAIQFEFGRAIRDGVKSMLWEHLLPRLLSEGTAQQLLWTHFAEAATDFERKMAPLRGVSVVDNGGGSSGEVLPPLATADGCLTVVYDALEWRQAWLAAERGNAEAAVMDAIDSADAWEPASTTWSSMDLDTASSSVMLLAWQQELWPSVASQAVISMVAHTVSRAAWLPAALQRRTFLEAVPKEALRAVLARLGRAAQHAAEYRDLAGPKWAPRIASYVSAAHHVEHALREGPGPLLLLDLKTTETSMSSLDAAGGGPFEREASQFGAFRREWSLKVAKAAAAAFQEGTKAYRLNLDEFSTGEDLGDGALSPRLAPAVVAAADTLALLAAHMDAVVFREVWRAFAAAANRLLYNDVATEAAFSPQGAANFGRECSAVATLVAPYTRRPAAHFRELLDAASILQLPYDQAASLASALDATPDGNNSDALRAAGVTRLTSQQAKRVLQHRI